MLYHENNFFAFLTFIISNLFFIFNTIFFKIMKLITEQDTFFKYA